MIARIAKGTAAGIGALVVLTLLWWLVGAATVPPAVPLTAVIAGVVTWYVT